MSSDEHFQNGRVRAHAKTAGGRRRLLPWLALALLAGLAGLASALLTGGADDEQATLETLQQTLINASVFPKNFRSVPEFTLIDSQGSTVTETLFDGQYSLVFFGFTHCPDVCPLTLSIMQTVFAELDERGIEPMQLVFVSVDPTRDTPEVVNRYVGYFHDEIIGLTGAPTAIQNLTGQLGIIASFSASKDNPSHYTVDHTASMLLVDPQRRIRAKFNAPHAADSIVADYLTLRDAL